MNAIAVVAPIDGSLERLLASDTSVAFDARLLEFSAILSNALMRDPRTREFPEVVAMAYWLRKANITRLQQDFVARTDNVRVARGTAFHIAPSNVDTIFIYSLFLSMFCGNRNIVRLSSTPNAQVDSILAVFNDCLQEYPELSESLLIVRYEHSEEITQQFSELCDLRIIWGGDETIRRIRAIPIPARCKELTFADRFSMALIDVEHYLSLDDAAREKACENFYNDSYWFAQMACSSPRMVFWLGSDEQQCHAAKTAFWSLLEHYSSEQAHDIAAASIMEKLLTQCEYAVTSTAAVQIPKVGTHLVSRIDLPTGVNPLTELHCGNGLFLETELSTLSQLGHYLDTKVQTLSVLGVSGAELRNFIRESKPAGLDRAVPFGQALNFSPVWDGYDLLDELSRIVDLPLLS